MSDTAATEWLWHTDLEDPGLGSLVGHTVRDSDGRRLGTVLRTVDHPEYGLLVVNTGPWIFGRLLAVPAGLVSDVDHEAGSVRVTCDRRRLKRGPAYRADSPEAVENYRARAATYFARTRRPTGSRHDRA
ncbi:PRC-barrel domain-containing protein [Streptacidiphilus melanogenes]|uniref:PRC-barrel domain-containing protein n=1 Tax=Streptacidiphilus melanogenes TaxID=411235 RepID=UPI0006943B47|nr:PRC-barrel domain-containing protein [Streptacidiphilus melanogenes]